MKPTEVGKLIEDPAQLRDAIHVAVLPVVASVRVHAAQDVGLRDGAVSLEGPHVGIIDPFLKRPVFPGERCWLFMYPQTITSLRHDWTHPALEPEKPTPTKAVSEAWLRGYAERFDVTFDVLIAACKDQAEGGFGHRLPSDVPDEAFDPLLWLHYANVSGDEIDEDTRTSSPFWCGC